MPDSPSQPWSRGRRWCFAIPPQLARRQHVLEPLAGYLILAERLHAAATLGGPEVAEAWNFGRDAVDVVPVSAIADRIVALWGDGARWTPAATEGLHEAGHLAVDASKARARLGWRPRLGLDEALAWTIDWHRRHRAGESAQSLIDQQIEAYQHRVEDVAGAACVERRSAAGSCGRLET